MRERKLLRTYWKVYPGPGRPSKGPFSSLAEVRTWVLRGRKIRMLGDGFSVVRVRVYAKQKWTAENERAAIVQFLWKHSGMHRDAIAAIERGDHLPKETK